MVISEGHSGAVPAVGAVPDAAVFAAHGEVDVATADNLRSELERLLVDGHLHLIVDLGDVTFLDSSGLGALVAVFRLTTAVEGSLSIRNPQPQVRRVFELTRTDTVIPIIF